ncbi:MAG TPA: DUF2304 domain-containing protein [Planctomicrobium sp.]|nr:DUF2304 domain-containing protein [Planctomicrobium sp.]
MIIFQVLAIPLLLLFVAVELVRIVRSNESRRMRMVRIVLGLAMIVTIQSPSLTTRVAHLLGIGRGTDLLLYLSCFAFIAISFHLYSRTVQLERTITELIRQDALAQAVHGGKTNRDETVC